MVFSSIIFLNLFLPVFLLVYLAVPSRFKNPVLILASSLFYAWGAPKVLPLLFLTTWIDYWCSRKFKNKDKSERKWLWLSVMVNILSLAWFKYSNFFVGELSRLNQYFGEEPLSWTAVALPIGISFFTFQKISYLVDVWQKRAEPPESFWQYLLFVICFPQLIAGPIVRFHDIAHQLKVRKHTIDSVFEGCSRFLIGLGKKVLIANPLAWVADTIFALGTDTLPCHYAWLGIICYAMQIYFDFSGYSDMAIGLGRMIGFKFPENFNNPYISRNITEFWRRWHITLSEWMKLYLYIPLGGNRSGKLRTYFNLWIVFLLSGLWHGASWNFIAWGAFHGFFLVVDKLYWQKLSLGMPRVLSTSITFIIVLFGWVLFRAETLPQALSYAYQMLDFSDFGEAHHWMLTGELLQNRTRLVLVLALALSFAPAFSLKNFQMPKDFTGELTYKPFGLNPSGAVSSTLIGATMLVILLLCTMSLVSASFNPFIYFRF